MDIVVENVDTPSPPSMVSVTAHKPVEHLAIAERFNIRTPSKEEDEKLSTIWGYVKSKGGERDISDIVWDVINLEMQLGSPKLGESRLDRLYRYVKLRVNESRIREQLKDVSNSAGIH